MTHKRSQDPTDIQLSCITCCCVCSHSLLPIMPIALLMGEVARQVCGLPGNCLVEVDVPKYDYLCRGLSSGWLRLGLPFCVVTECGWKMEVGVQGRMVICSTMLVMVPDTSFRRLLDMAEMLGEGMCCGCCLQPYLEGCLDFLRCVSHK